MSAPQRENMMGKIIPSHQRSPLRKTRPSHIKEEIGQYSHSSAGEENVCPFCSKEVH